MADLASDVVRVLAWYMVMGYPPTAEEVWWFVRPDRDPRVLEALVQEGKCFFHDGRYGLSGYESLVLEHERRNRFFARKWQRAQRLAALLRWMPTVRWMALCNTMAIGHARDEADIDVCIVVHRGTLWMTRLLLAGMATLVGRRPGERAGERDAWCFSFLLDDSDLSFDRFALRPQDPYLAWWTVRLVPLLDDGIGRRLWLAQDALRARYPHAPEWLAWRTKPAAIDGAFVWLMRIDRWLGWLERRFGSSELQRRASEGGTSVIMTDAVLKTHIDDRRDFFRTRYETLCQSLGIAPYLDV